MMQGSRRSVGRRSDHAHIAAIDAVQRVSPIRRARVRCTPHYLASSAARNCVVDGGGWHRAERSLMKQRVSNPKCSAKGSQSLDTSPVKRDAPFV